MLKFLLISATLLFAQTMTATPEYKKPESNSNVNYSNKKSVYFTLDTNSIYALNLYINRVTLISFPARVKLTVCGNTAEIKTTVEEHMVYVKPLLGTSRSNIHVTLYSGEVITIELTCQTVNENINERVFFSYPDANPYLDFAKSLSSAYDHQKNIAVAELKASLEQTIPSDMIKDLVVYRCTDSRKNTSLKHEGYQVFFDAMVSTKQYTYFTFYTNAKENKDCPITSIDKIEVKSKSRDKLAIDFKEILNNASRIIIQTPVIGDTPEEMKLFIHAKFYGLIKVMKVNVQ